MTRIKTKDLELIAKACGGEFKYCKGIFKTQIEVSLFEEWLDKMLIRHSHGKRADGGYEVRPEYRYGRVWQKNRSGKGHPRSEYESGEKAKAPPSRKPIL